MLSGFRAVLRASRFWRAPAAPDPLDYQTAFKFGHHRDDGDDDGAARRAARIQLLTEADELDVEMAEFVQHFEKMPCGTCPAVTRPHHHDIELSQIGRA